MDFSKYENALNIKLDDVQKNTLSSLIANYKDTNAITVRGKAGTGKTLLLQILAAELNDNNVTLAICAPTNKALDWIEQHININVEFHTLHSLLNLKPHIDILDFDAKEMEFLPTSYNSFQVYDVLIIDECSMINDYLFDLLIKLSNTYNIKLIFFGDSAQLAPVKQYSISKVFSSVMQLELNTVYRQKEGVLYPLLDLLRTTPVYNFLPLQAEDAISCLIVETNIKDLLTKYIHLFQFGIDIKDPTLIKLLTYTNNRVSALNKIIRNCLYKSTEEYCVGELLTAYDTIINSHSNLENSQDYIILSVTPVIFESLKAFKLELQSNNSRFFITVLSRNNSDAAFNNLAFTIEKQRKQAVKLKSTKVWAKWYEFIKSFASPIDLIYQGKTVKKKSIDYGYCISVHKSQASEYQNVIIDMENILRCSNIKTLRQLQYVALSRTKGNVIIYQRNG